MNERFERYNEITFEAYCKAAIDNAVHRGVRKKERRAEREPPLTELNDAVLFRLDPTDAPQEAVLEEAITFEVCDQHITVHNAALGARRLHTSRAANGKLRCCTFLRI